VSPTDDDPHQIGGDDHDPTGDGGVVGVGGGRAVDWPAPLRQVMVRDAVRGWQRALADVGGPNTLLWYQDLPLGTLDLTTAHPGGLSKLLAGRATTIADLVRERSSVAPARARARSIAATCDRVLEQRGLHVGFLALGLATWETAGGRSLQAPVLLRPIMLRPHGRAVAGPRDAEVELALGREVEVNPVLVRALRARAGIELDGAALAASSVASGGFDPRPAYAVLQAECADLPGFAVAPRLVVGTFPHSKLQMVADLADRAADLTDHDVVAALAGDEGARAAVRARTPDPAPDPDRDPAAERLVLPLDASQGDVVDAVLRGASLAVTTAPGTGATQTVAALVAALAGEGRSVLVVSPLRRDLTDLIGRLDHVGSLEGMGGVGLGDLVLDAAEAATDRRATLQQVVDSFQSVVDRSDRRDHLEPGGLAGVAAPDPGVLTAHRDVLRDHVAALHEIRAPWGVSLHEAQWAIAELALRSPAPSSRVRLTGPTLQGLPRVRFDEMAQRLTDAARAGAWSDRVADDPWYGAHVPTEADAERAQEIVTRLSGGGLERATAALDAVMQASSLPRAASVDDWAHALGIMAGVRSTLEVFRPEVFDTPLDEHVASTASAGQRRSEPSAGAELGVLARARVRSQARRLLRPGRPPADLHAELVAARRHRRAWHELVGAGGRPEISPQLDEALLTYERLRDDLGWLGGLLATTRSAGGDLAHLPLPDLGDRLATLAQHPDRLRILPQVIPVIEDLRASGLGEVVDDFAARTVGADEVTTELEHVWWVSVVRHVTRTDPYYAAHDGDRLRDAATGYVVADTAHSAATAARVRAVVDRRTRDAVSSDPEAAAGLLAEADGSGRPRSVRDLLGSSAALLLATRPCWVLSPYAVAETVPPGPLFDVVVIDSAGLITPQEAISALTRARQVVVLGDPAGPPPTPFTTSPPGPPALPSSAPNVTSDPNLAVDPSDANASTPTAEADLITTSGLTTTSAPIARSDPGKAPVADTVGPSTPGGAVRSAFDALAEVLPTRRLVWDHTTTDERLVRAADHAAYGLRLMTAPGVREPSPVSVERVQGAGRVVAGTDTAIESTEAEVSRVVELVIEHARTRPNESLGVIAVTAAHAARLRAVLDHELRGLEEGAAFFGHTGRNGHTGQTGYTGHVGRVGPGASEAFDVRGLGDLGPSRWDAVILSVGYGKTPHGRVLYRFPDLMAPGADRLLVSATRRARTRLTLVSALGADDLDVDRLRGPGPLALRGLLVDLTAAAHDPRATGDRARDPLMADLGDRLRREGLEVLEDVGSGRHLIDLVVTDPDHPDLPPVAVEGDGASYAAMSGTRERDRLWEKHLTGLGWRFVRVWSTDLYRDPAREVARVIAATRPRPAGQDEQGGSGEPGGQPEPQRSRE